MSLILIVVRGPEAVLPRREVPGGDFSIGRGADNDWVLADPDRHLSKRHCRLTLRGGRWRLADLSANGTYLNHAAAPVGAGPEQALSSGDRISLGAYEIEVAISAPERPAPPPRPADAVTRAAAPVAAAPVAATPAARPHDTELLAALLRGLGMAGAALPDPLRAIEAAGAALRAAVGGIRQALIARASIKGEFRIEQTMIRAAGNNPLKFSADDDDTLAAFMGLGRHPTMPPAQAVAEALRDIRLHELATISAMQAAVRALLAQFDPAAIDRNADKGGLAKLPGQAKARAWDAFAAMHAKVTQDLSDNFDSVFGKVFARSYEQAMHEMSARGDAP